LLTAILVSLGLVFLAELGDKSQLMAVTYTLRHRWWVVLVGIAVSSLLVHGLSVAIGHFLGLTLPARPMAPPSPSERFSTSGCLSVLFMARLACSS
jgi:putative Ca2+/H+ antiporter (TMEM165/GDT1 family)